MKKIILIYTSMTGNTEMLAGEVIKGLEQMNVELTVKEAFDSLPTDLLDYDGFIIGTYTWEGEVPNEFMDFFEELDHVDLSGKKAAVFGSGDSYYGSTYGAALRFFTEKITLLGAEVLLPNLVIDLYPEDAELEQCLEFGRTFAELMFDNS
ncbi:flavodoxin [Lederbergia wuyishanensis]|uniref:Flavodoxin n=1 Tax=Lederbergia wuyishanensis TaxID=1347903 RepID=A0ABU0D7P0_9BACI|nr:flavodoxin [Lederbergia wuyishanensis]MCJ8009061.1 flavodoxin [Lederbergia wuyishanensis]MDQ0344397.1 flavodoxin I [Lederbergia wuyishanensis]